MDSAQPSTSSSSSSNNDVRRPDKVHPYRVGFWADIVSEDSTSEIMNVLGMMLSMLGILLKYKTCAWFGVLVAAVSYANVRSNYDSKQIMSTFMLSMSSVVMCYITNPQPISVYLSQSATQSMPLDTTATTSSGGVDSNINIAAAGGGSAEVAS